MLLFMLMSYMFVFCYGTRQYVGIQKIMRWEVLQVVKLIN